MAALEVGTTITDTDDGAVGEVLEIDLMEARGKSLPIDPVVVVQWQGHFARTESYWQSQIRWSDDLEGWTVFSHGIGAHHLVALGM